MTEAPQRRGSDSKVGRVLAAIGVVELTIGALSLLTILVLVFLQALQRYLPIDQFAWTGEISRFSLVWMTFALMGWLVTSRGHIALEIADALPRPILVRIVQTFALLIVAATGIGLTLEAYALVSTQGIIMSPVLRIPMSWVYIPVLVGAVSTTIRATYAAYDVARYGPVLSETQELENDSLSEVRSA